MFKGFQKPKRLVANTETLTERYGQFSAQPFERGFGPTIGNGLRGVLLSSIEGAAITGVRIEGVSHEFTGDTFLSHRLLIKIPKLSFENPVVPPRLLLFTQLQAIAYDLCLFVFSVLTGSEVSLLDRTFICETFWPLEEQLHALAAA